MTIDKEIQNKECIWHYVLNNPTFINNKTKERIMEKVADHNKLHLPCSHCFGYTDACKGYVLKKIYNE